MKHYCYQVFEDNELYDRFIAELKNKNIPHSLQHINTGHSNAVGLPGNYELSATAQLTAVLAPLPCFAQLNSLLEPLVAEFYPGPHEASALKLKFRTAYAVNKIEFFIIKQQLVEKKLLEDCLEETDIVSGYVNAQLQRTMSVAPFWLLGIFGAVNILAGTIAGPLICIAFAVYAYDRGHRKQQLPNGSFISLYDARSVKNASLLFMAALVLLAVAIVRLYQRQTG